MTVQAGRNLQPYVINKFKGINKFASAAVLGPEFALDLLNVMIAKSGEMRKLRVPLDIADAVAAAVGKQCYGLWDFQQGNGTRQIIAVYGTQVYKYDWSGVTWVPTLVDDNADNAYRWSAVESNNVLYMANGVRMMKWTGTNFWQWGVSKPQAAPAITATVAGAVITNRKYRAAFKNSVTGHEGSGSDLSANMVSATSVTVKLNDPATRAKLDADPQIDTIVWYATVSQGVEFFKHSEVAVTPGDQVLNDNKTDAQLDKLTRISLINDPPPVGKYLVVSGGRIFIGDLDGSPQDVVYSGYEQVRNGRPEESFPPNNRLRLAIGADFVRGMGVVQSGVFIGSKSNEMFMFRGDAEDVVTGEPISYSATLEPLPYQTGIGSHYTVQSTPLGGMFLSANRTVDNYMGGANAPDTYSDAINSIIRDIPKGREESCQAIFFNYLDKDWYVLGVPEPGSGNNMSKLVIFDLGKNAEETAGIYIFAPGFFQGLARVEDVDGRPMIVVAMDGKLKEVRTFTDEINGLPQALAEDDSGEELGAYYQPGYLGNDDPNIVKLWRHVTVESTYPVRVQARLVDRDFTSIKYIERSVDEMINGRASINWKSRRMSPGIIFPVKDCNINVLTIQAGWVPLSDR